MKKITVLILFVCLMPVFSHGQTSDERFTPTGKVFMRIFTNVHSTISNGNAASAFELDRAYIGYDAQLSKQFSGKINIDIGNPGNGSAFEMTAYIKNAYLSYTNASFSASFGLIPTIQFDQQEKTWGYRYIEKSFQDAYKFGSSADLGFSANYKFTNWLDASLIIINGEGYKKLQSDSIFKAGLGITVKPIPNLMLFGYYDAMGSENTQNTLATFISYRFDKGSFGAEFNQQNNTGNISNRTLSGFSVYATAVPSKKTRVFARFDQLTSNTLPLGTANWNHSKDGSLAMAGIEYEPVKGVKISPNYRLWIPADQDKKSTHFIYLNFEIKY